MKQKDFLASMQKTYDECMEIVRKKNADYATSNDSFANFKNSTVAGVTLEKGILVRVLDKITRTSNILDKNGKTEVKESLKDNLQDSINYLAILLVYLDEVEKGS